MNINFSDFDNIAFKDISDSFEQERNGKLLRRDIMAFFCSNEYPSSIQTINLTDVIVGDVLIHTKSKKRCYIIDVIPIGNDVIAKYETDYQRKKQSNAISQIFHINSISGNSIIGNQQVATIETSSIENLEKIISDKLPEDREELEKFLERLKIIIEDNQPVSKGTFSKFKEILSKYPDIINSAGSLILKWLSSID